MFEERAVVYNIGQLDVTAMTRAVVDVQVTCRASRERSVTCLCFEVARYARVVCKSTKCEIVKTTRVRM